MMEEVCFKASAVGSLLPAAVILTSEDPALEDKRII